MNHSHDFPSGKWVGFYLEPHRRDPGWMHLYLACDNEGNLQGEGVDYVGPWTLLGRFTSQTKQCEWTKHYVNKHKVTYRGTLGAEGIVGDWQIRPLLEGRFHIWPESMSHLHEHYLRQAMPEALFAPLGPAAEILKTSD